MQVKEPGYQFTQQSPKGVEVRGFVFIESLQTAAEIIHTHVDHHRRIHELHRQGSTVRCPLHRPEPAAILTDESKNPCLCPFRLLAPSILASIIFHHLAMDC